MSMPAWLTDIRANAQRRFDELGYPSPKLEDWRFTNVAPIARAKFHISPNGASRGEQFREFSWRKEPASFL